ncbi:MAG: hypothetical protein JRJ12_01110 [Deltaproteobacteria bacterium]|nr:hypothetical protein [Deltaproteobacteria bacterium]MBW2070068.1 hypothetical protein [Deltaproteobacteria bacterium]
MFATGTAAVISPVGLICYQGKDFRVADGQTGELPKKFHREITGIQYGRREDHFGWKLRAWREAFHKRAQGKQLFRSCHNINYDRYGCLCRHP